MDGGVPQQVKTCTMGEAASFLFPSLRERQHISCYQKISRIPCCFILKRNTPQLASAGIKGI
jgi:hypothetical protein